MVFNRVVLTDENAKNHEALLLSENNKRFRAAILLGTDLPYAAPLCNTKRQSGKQKAADPFESTAYAIGGIE
jgi:hypothetical protein